MNKECFAQEVLARKEKLYRIAYCYVKNEQDSLDLFRAMDSLPEKDRACVVLRYFEEKSFVEISQILQEPESTVKSRLLHALV